uniref:Ovule protein n=1 Tax=Brugia timori TaxID=42155 RepID=A0A0R3QIS2_9BILA
LCCFRDSRVCPTFVLQISQLKRKQQICFFPFFCLFRFTARRKAIVPDFSFSKVSMFAIIVLCSSMTMPCILSICVRRKYLLHTSLLQTSQ